MKWSSMGNAFDILMLMMKIISKSLSRSKKRIDYVLLQALRVMERQLSLISLAPHVCHARFII